MALPLMDWFQTKDDEAERLARDAEVNRRALREALVRELAGVEAKRGIWQRRADAYAAEAAEAEPHWRIVAEAEQYACQRKVDDLAARADLIRLEIKAAGK